MNKKISLDLWRLIASFLIVAIHIYPFASINNNLDFIFTHVFCRIGVPLFLIITGYFVLGKSTKEIKKYTIKILKIYLLATVIYLPINIYSKGLEVNIITLLKDLFINGTFYHLWYFPALILGIWLVHYLINHFKDNKVKIIVTILFIIGLLGDSYYGITSNISILNTIYNGIFMVFDYTRNGLFYVPIFLYIGYKFKSNKLFVNNKINIILIIIAIILMIIEGLILNNLNYQRHDSMYIILVPLMILLFNYFINNARNENRELRSIATIIYIMHPMFIVLVRGFAKVVNLESIMIDNNLIHYLLVLISTLIFAIIVTKLKGLFKKDTSSLLTNRAWIEVDLANLEHNIDEIKKNLANGTEIMAVVKANAYGHDSIIISKKLMAMGITSYAVATLEEGIVLRENGIVGDILILGSTDIKNISYVIKYNLIATIVDYNYALEISKLKIKKKLRVHIKVNTGMNRLGESYKNIDNIAKIYNINNILVEGIYTHLCVADSKKQDDVNFTKKQIANFSECITGLKDKKINVGKVHYQSSYGFTNYSIIPSDYVRIGIIMYGVNSEEASNNKLKLDLKPVLTLKAKITSIKDIENNEAVSYGRNYIAKKKTKIATVAIGYADGYPRNLSNKDVLVKVNNSYAKIIGNICMDQLVIDITNIKNVRVGDSVTLIGDDEKISAVKIAEASGTITNELLSRLGNRLPRIKK